MNTWSYGPYILTYMLKGIMPFLYEMYSICMPLTRELSCQVWRGSMAIRSMNGLFRSNLASVWYSTAERLGSPALLSGYSTGLLLCTVHETHTQTHTHTHTHSTWVQDHQRTELNQPSCSQREHKRRRWRRAVWRDFVICWKRQPSWNAFVIAYSAIGGALMQWPASVCSLCNKRSSMVLW